MKPLPLISFLSFTYNKKKKKTHRNNAMAEKDQRFLDFFLCHYFGEKRSEYPIYDVSHFPLPTSSKVLLLINSLEQKWVL